MTSKSNTRGGWRNGGRPTIPRYIMTEKMRGHIGAWLERKAPRVLGVRKYSRIPRKLKKVLKMQGRYTKGYMFYER